VVSVGGEAAERRVDGGVELAGVLWVAAACSGVWKRGGGERTGGMGRWGFCSARARERRERRPLQRACHRGGEVAAARAALGGVAKREGTSAQPRAVEEEQLDAWAPARCRTWPGRPSTAPATALHSGGGEKQRKELEVEERIILQFLKIPGTSL